MPMRFIRIYVLCILSMRTEFKATTTQVDCWFRIWCAHTRSKHACPKILTKTAYDDMRLPAKQAKYTANMIPSSANILICICTSLNKLKDNNKTNWHCIYLLSMHVICNKDCVFCLSAAPQRRTERMECERVELRCGSPLNEQLCNSGILFSIDYRNLRVEFQSPFSIPLCRQRLLRRLQHAINNVSILRDSATASWISIISREF